MRSQQQTIKHEQHTLALILRDDESHKTKCKDADSVGRNGIFAHVSRIDIDLPYKSF